MKNKLFLGLAVLLIAGAFTGCKDEILDVRIVPDKANAVASVTATVTGDSGYLILTWDAVDNVGGYYVYVREKDTKTVNFMGQGQNTYTYAVADGAQSTNTNPDKWSTLVTLSSAGLTAGKSYEFGVQTYELVGNADSSDIVWSNVVTAP